MAKESEGTAIQYGSTLYLPVVSAIARDSLYENVNINSGDKLKIEIFGSIIKFTKKEV